MSLIRYSHPLMNLQQQVNRMLDQFDSDLFGHLEELGEGTFAPPVDVKEDDAAYTVHLEVPGVSQENLNLTLQDSVLTVRGTKERKQVESEGRYRRIERFHGTFTRSLSLPRNVDPNGVTAHLEDGVLEVRLAKREEARPRQINIGVTRAAMDEGTSNGGTTGADPLEAPANGAPANGNSGQGGQPNQKAPIEDATERETNGSTGEDAPEGHPS